MKKTVLLFISVVMALGVAAQSHSFRDTSYMKYWQFDLVGFFGDTTGPLRRGYNQMGGPVFPPGTGSLMGRDDVLQYNYTDNPDGMRVIGISAVIEMGGPNQGCPMDPPEYLLLYDALTDTFELKAMIQWEICDTAGRPWYDWIVNVIDGKLVTWSEGFGVSEPPHYYRVFDMYFDEPVTVYDSFYVGGTQRMLLGNSNRGTSYFCYTLVFWDTTTMVPTYNSSILWKIYSYESHGGNCTPYQWHWTQTAQWMMVLPIIEVVDTSFANAPTCPRVSGLFARGNYTDTVKVQWDYDSLHQEFELAPDRMTGQSSRLWITSGCSPTPPTATRRWWRMCGRCAGSTTRCGGADGAAPCTSACTARGRTRHITKGYRCRMRRATCRASCS